MFINILACNIIKDQLNLIGEKIKMNGIIEKIHNENVKAYLEHLAGLTDQEIKIIEKQRK